MHFSPRPGAEAATHGPERGDRSTGNITFLVTHRFSTVRSADLIIVLNNGTIVESGDHQELMNDSGGLYRELYELQSRGYQTQ